MLEASLAEPRWDDGRLSLEWFTEDEVRDYFALLDGVFAASALPAPSALIHAHLVCSAIARCAVVNRDEAVWAGRRHMLERVLPAYLRDDRVPLALSM